MALHVTILSMKTFTVEDIEHLSKLARMTLNDEERQRLVPQLNSILNFVEVLNKVDTSAVSPTLQGTGLSNQLRADLASNADSGWFDRKQLFTQMPDHEGDLLRVPAILKKS